MSLYHNKNITAYNIISKKNKQKTLGKTQNPLNTDPTAQSLLQKYNFVNNGQKLHESRYQIFVVLSNWAWFLYFNPKISS